jgi:Predicted amidophosphoribosyltransferases
MWMKTLWSDLLSLFFPNICVVCKSPLVAGEEQICLNCLCKLPRINASLFGNPAGELFKGNGDIISARSFLYYSKGNSLQKIVHSFKYYDNKKLALVMGKLAASGMGAMPERIGPDVLMPVPLHPHRMRQRGYNQSEWIALGLGSVWNIPVDTTHLVRSKRTDSQTRKSIYERQVSISNSFSLLNGDELRGKHILLVDDVVTSGATMEACANELLRHGKIKVSVFSLAIAK